MDQFTYTNSEAGDLTVIHATIRRTGSYGSYKLIAEWVDDDNDAIITHWVVTTDSILYDKHNEDGGDGEYAEIASRVIDDYYQAN